MTWGCTALGQEDVESVGRSAGERVGDPPAARPAGGVPRGVGGGRVADGVDRTRPAEVNAHVDALRYQAVDGAERISVSRRRGGRRWLWCGVPRCVRATAGGGVGRRVPAGYAARVRMESRARARRPVSGDRPWPRTVCPSTTPRGYWV